ALFFSTASAPPTSTLFPYTTLFRSAEAAQPFTQRDGFAECEAGILFPELEQGDSSVDGLIQHPDRIAAAAVLASHDQVEGVADRPLHPFASSRRWAQWLTGPWPPSSSRGWRMAAVMYSFAFRTASKSGRPLASSAVKAAEKVQPVPWVCRVSMRGAVRCSKDFPSKNRSTAFSPRR